MLPIATMTSEHRGGPIAIHPAAPDDEWAIRSLFAALHAHNAALEPRFALAAGWQQHLAEQLARERMTGNGFALLAWAGAEPVGLAMIAGNPSAPLFRHKGWAELTALYVVPALRGTELANDLMDAALGWARDKGFAELRLYVTARNNRARRFCAGAGLRPIQEVWMTAVDSTVAALPANGKMLPLISNRAKEESNVETTRFEERLHSVASGRSRRGVVAGLACGLLSALSLKLAAGDAEAKKKGKRRNHNKKRKNKRRPTLPPLSPSGPIVRADAKCPGPRGSSFSTDGEARIAQTFTALATGPLLTASVDIIKIAGASGDLLLQLAPLDDGGRPTNDVLAEAAVAYAEVPDGATTVNYVFPRPFSVVAGTSYALVLTQSQANQLVWAGRGGNSCGGAAFFSSSQVAAFVNLDDNLDLIYATFVSS